MEDKCNIQHAYRKILVRPETKIFLKKKHLFFVLSILWGGISMFHEEKMYSHGYVRRYALHFVMIILKFVIFFYFYENLLKIGFYNFETMKNHYL